MLEKKYGFFTAVSMVIGIVIGSGVFKSAGDVLNASGGSLPIAILAWFIGGLIMIVSSYTFSLVAVRIEKNSGLVDYIEAAAGEKVGYLTAWFMTVVYYPTLIGILAWLGGNITAAILPLKFKYASWIFGFVYLCGTYLLNFLSPILSGKWQVSTTFIKLIPLFLIAIVGLTFGLITGTTLDSITIKATNASGGSLATATAITAFAYEGWIIATTINSELKDAKKNLPKALIMGSLIVVISYILFFIGISGVISNNEAINLSGSLDTTVEAASRLFGDFFGNIVIVLVLLSVLGTLNGLTLGGVRGMYAISMRNIGPYPHFFKQTSKSNATVHSGIISFVLTLFWSVIWFGNFEGWWNNQFINYVQENSLFKDIRCMS